MEALYGDISQFSVMETLVKQLNSTRESLSDTDNMGNFNKWLASLEFLAISRLLTCDIRYGTV